MSANLRVDAERLSGRLEALARIGALPGGGVCRLALTDEDKAARDLLVSWMKAAGLRVTVDAIGNIFGLRPGIEDGPPVMTGSHIDTVRTGGIYDGTLGVLAGLEAVERLNEAGIATRRPIAVAAFTNEEGARFQPDMLGSLVAVGGLALEEALATQGIDGTELGAELRRIGYAGDAPTGALAPRAFVELHVEQGPILDHEGGVIGAVETVQGISWQEITIAGQSNHAGTTPMRLRRDAGYAAAAVAVFLRGLAEALGGDQVATCGAVTLHPNLINVIPERAVLTADLRNTDEAALQEAEARLARFLAELAGREGVAIETRRLARFEPVVFDAGIAARIAETAERLGHPVRRMTSGAGHDAQMLARVCPTAMIFVPSVDGVSHNVTEYTKPEHVATGADVLLQTLLSLAE